jgi:ADP-ribose pyrophosphatase
MKLNLEQLQEETIRSQSIFQGRVISLQVDEVRLPNGQRTNREIVKHPGAVAIMAFHQDRLLVVAQYRKALEKIQVEIPAGKLEVNEDLLMAAQRELEEETGYRAQTMRHISSFYTSPGFANEILHLYVTDDIVPGERNPDDDEFIECAFLTYEQALEYARNGQISDAKTKMALFAWQAYKMSGEWMNI